MVIKVTEFQLDVSSQPGSPIRFLRAEVPNVKKHAVPVALVWYSVSGKEQEIGLRLDRDKRAFIDSIDDAVWDDPQKEAASEIAEFLGRKLYPETDV